MTLLFRVADVFHVPNRGCVISAADMSASCRAGDEIVLRTPSGRELATCIKAIEILKSLKAPRSRPAIVLPAEIKKQDVPAGTEVWRIAPKETARS